MRCPHLLLTSPWALLVLLCSCGPGTEQPSNLPCGLQPPLHLQSPATDAFREPPAQRRNCRLDRQPGETTGRSGFRQRPCCGARGCWERCEVRGRIPHPLPLRASHAHRLTGIREGKRAPSVTGDVKRGLFTCSAVSKHPGCAAPPRGVSRRTSSASAELSRCCPTAPPELLPPCREADANAHTPAELHRPAPKQQVGDQGGPGRMALLTHLRAPEEPSLIHSLTLQEVTLFSVQ